MDGQEGPADVCVIELGGTIGTSTPMMWIKMSYSLVIIKLKINLYYAGDIESMPFIEALGQFSYRVGKNNECGMLF